ncbi:MAG: hypothetical protein MJ082_00095 [Clostridia bacterium]|nr:hypothetical protein [Clostridia bacterium]
MTSYRKTSVTGSTRSNEENGTYPAVSTAVEIPSRLHEESNSQSDSGFSIHSPPETYK